MKRTVNHSPASSSSTSPNEVQPVKRMKTYKACTLCRHHKTRCESGETFADGSPACRRCRHFKKRCSLEDGSPSGPWSSPPMQDTTPGPSSRPPIQSYQHELEPEDTIPPQASSSIPIPKAVMRSGMHTSNQDTTSVVAMKMAIQLLFRSEEDVDESLEWGEPLNLVRGIVSGPNPQQLPPALLLSALPSDDTHELHKLYHSLYSPWIGWETTHPPESTTPLPIFLQSVKNMLAIRHCSPTLREMARSQAESEARSGLYKTMLQGTEDINALRAMHILALYTSLASALSPAAPGDSTLGYGNDLLIASALRLAHNMYLRTEIQVILDIRRTTPPLLKHANASTSVLESLAKCRLLYSLLVTESFIQIGKGRKPDGSDSLSQAGAIFGSPHILLTTSQGSAIADARLVLLSQLCMITSRGFEVPVPENIGSFPTAMRGIMSKFESWLRDFIPLKALTDDHVALELDLVLLHFYFCKLAVMCRVILAVIRISRRIRGSGTFTTAEHENAHDAPPTPGRPWFMESISTAESLIATALSLPRFNQSSFRKHVLPSPHPLASAPDYILSMIAFAALFIVKSQLHINYNTEQNKYALTSRATVRAKETVRRGLVIRLMKLMKDVAGGEENLAGRYAKAIEMLLSVWEASRPRDDGGDGSTGEESSFQGSFDTEDMRYDTTVGQDTFLGPHTAIRNGLGAGAFASTSTFAFDTSGGTDGVGGGGGDDDPGNSDPSSGLFDMSLFDLQFTFNPMSGFS